MSIQVFVYWEHVAIQAVICHLWCISWISRAVNDLYCFSCVQQPFECIHILRSKLISMRMAQSRWINNEIMSTLWRCYGMEGLSAVLDLMPAVVFSWLSGRVSWWTNNKLPVIWDVIMFMWRHCSGESYQLIKNSCNKYFACVQIFNFRKGQMRGVYFSRQAFEYNCRSFNRVYC